jgi:hypothetical protein
MKEIIKTSQNETVGHLLDLKLWLMEAEPPTLLVVPCIIQITEVL